MSRVCYSIPMKKALSLFFGILIFCFFGIFNPAHAVSEFTTTFNSLYTISASGVTTVTHTIALKNNLSHIYATDYTIAVSGDQLSHITAFDESGPISSSANIQNGVTTIHLTIARPAIGQDQTKTLTLSYQTLDVVEVIGQTTTVNIPRLAKANEAQSYTRIVKIEGVQDLPSLIYPPQTKTEPDGAFTVFTFDGHQNDSLTLLFGSSVTYKLNLTYELRNKELSAADSELALPPDTGYQHIILASLSPSPENIRLDPDGNWLARYALKGQEKLLVKAELYATVYPQPKLIDPSTVSLEKTKSKKYWDPASPIVTDLAGQLKTPENIYHYITSNFTYNYGGVTTGADRQGSLSTLTSPTGVLCTEFTDAFVALARAAQFPSREINGYGYTKNSTLQPQNTTSDILHAWPEYYDETKKAWIGVDPTWGNTTGGIDYFNKLDFSHITFVRHGQEDSYPLPAGAYKSNPSEKYVYVEIATDLPGENISFEKRGNVIYNTGNVALVNDTVGYLPPYGSYTIPTPKPFTLYDKIKALCAKLLSKFFLPRPAST